MLLELTQPVWQAWERLNLQAKFQEQANSIVASFKALHESETQAIAHDFRALQRAFLRTIVTHSAITKEKNPLAWVSDVCGLDRGGRATHDILLARNFYSSSRGTTLPKVPAQIMISSPVSPVLVILHRI